MLDFLDRLCAALLSRRGLEVRALLQHPLARALPRTVIEEATAIADAAEGSVRAPVQTLHFYHQTMQLLASSPVTAPASAPAGVAETTPAAPKREVEPRRPVLTPILGNLAIPEARAPRPARPGERTRRLTLTPHCSELPRQLELELPPRARAS